MSAFDQALSHLSGRIPGLRMLIIMDTDGISVARWDARPDPLLEAVAAEYTTLLRASLAAAADTGLGALREVTVASEKMTALMSAITPEYFLFAALDPEAGLGRARYALRVAGLRLEKEFT